MIRLNDVDRTVIDESKVAAYYGYGEDKTCIVLSTCLYVDYYSQEQRDKDIELLDKIFDVKSIEDKANEEYDFGEPQVMNPKPTKEEYLTWDYVKQFECGVNAYLPDGSICKVYYEENNNRIQLGVGRGYIYDEDLFNALMLKKVE
jgi:hypothetical protein